MRALLAAGCETFFVACASEGERARAVSGEAVVYVFDGIAPGSAPRLKAAGLRPVLNSLAEIAEWAGAGPAALHFDTGMNRLGFAPAEAGAAAALLRAAPCLVMSHLVSAQSPDDPANARQIAAFDAIARRFPGVPRSLCNSSGIFLPSKPHLDLVRPGYALYGGNPTPGAAQPDARRVAPGGPYSRGPRHRGGRVRGLRRRLDRAAPDAPRHHRRRLRRRAAGRRVQRVLGAARRSAGRGSPLSRRRAGVDGLCRARRDARPARSGAAIGRKSSGEEIGVDELAARAGTIGYEILTRLGPSLRPALSRRVRLARESAGATAATMATAGIHPPPQGEGGARSPPRRPRLQHRKALAGQKIHGLVER